MSNQQNTTQDDTDEKVCPECGEPYLNVSKVDARPNGALFESYTHSYTSNAELIVEESCQHILEWEEKTEQNQ